MKKSVKIRKIIFEILYAIHQNSINFEEGFAFYGSSLSINEQEKSMIYNVVLNSIRNKFFINGILNSFLKKKTSNKIKILLISAITQIFYLDFKNYAVTFDTVEVAKIKKLNPALINALLKNLIVNSKAIDKHKLDYSSIPEWFINKCNETKVDVKKILHNVSNEPSLHLVFKNEIFLNNFKEEHIKTTANSAFILENKKIKNIENYQNGNWWVQDFASMLPIYLSSELKNKKILDMCSAPGGKAFQALSVDGDLVLNDINPKRLKILNKNLERLNFNCKLTNIDVLKMKEEQIFDVVILDSPCSGIGTLRRNPEILFKKKPPEIKNLINLQKNLIDKAAKFLKKQGVLIYMVCSFFYEETKAIKEQFLKNNKNFSHHNFCLDQNSEYRKFIDEDGDFYCIPSSFKNKMIDGFYAVKFIKND